MNTYNKFLIVLATIVALSGFYVYFSNNLNANAAGSDSSLVSSSSGAPADLLGATNDKISQDTAFLYTLTSLTKIKIDTSLFSESSFNSLNDNTVMLEPITPGRPNPFAPIAGAVVNSTSVSPVTTNTPDQVTAKSAVLNGSVSSTNGVTNTYFEYGPTPTLGKITPNSKQSLIGTFGSTITGLTSGTTYFYRAVAKINGTLTYGDVISFNTN